MALQKEKVLSNGTSGNYWRVSHLHFSREGMKLDMVISLYKDNTPSLTPLSVSYTFSFVITQQEIVGNLVAMAYNKIKAYASSDIPNINGQGTHKGCADLDGAIDV